MQALSTELSYLSTITVSEDDVPSGGVCVRLVNVFTRMPGESYRMY